MAYIINNVLLPRILQEFYIPVGKQIEKSSLNKHFVKEEIWNQKRH